jgi:Protein of unknown function (DUF3752)
VRGTSLVDLHTKASSSGKDDDWKPGIRDHERDMSLGGRLMDDGARNKLIQDSRKLGDKFSAGKDGVAIYGHGPSLLHRHNKKPSLV